MTDAPLILTLGLHADDQARFERLRAMHFPADRNFIPAHVTLFHHLPGREVEAIEQELERRCATVPPFELMATGLRFLGRGVAYSLEALALTTLRAGLAKQWRPWLTPQDQQGYRPHVTIQNKAEAEAARALHRNLEAAFTPFAIRADELLLWRYLGGPWEAAGRFAFAG